VSFGLSMVRSLSAMLALSEMSAFLNLASARILVFLSGPMSAARSISRELRKTAMLAFPITVSQVGQMLMGLLDTLMVGHVGVTSLAAAAFANSLVNLAFVFGIGLLASVGVLASQAHGAEMDEAKRAVLRGSVWFAVFVGGIVATILSISQPWLSLLGQPPEILETARPFMMLMSWSLIPALVFISAKSFCESLSRPIFPMIMMYVGVGLNVMLNWIFIFGQFGAPRLGLVGAGCGTLVSRIVTMTGTLWYCLWITRTPPSTISPVHIDLPTLRSLVTLGLPTGFQLLAESSAFSSAAILMGWISTTALAAHQIAITCAATTFMFPLGVSQAVSVRVGQAIGAGRYALVRTISAGGLGLSAGIMALFAIIYALFRYSIIGCFTSDHDVILLAGSLLIIAGLFQVADGVQVTALGGLRGLADVRIPMLLAFGFYWLFAIPVGYLTAFTWHLGAAGIWIGLAIGLFLAATVLTLRLWRLTSPGSRFAFVVPQEAE
jgi:MATE family multidrug resistance protein